MHETSQHEHDRRVKASKFKELGIDPFGSRYDGLSALSDVRAAYDAAAEGARKFRVAGRIMLKRDMGKLIFVTVRD